MSIVRDSKFDEEASVASVLIGATALFHLVISEADTALLVISLIACLVPIVLGSVRNILIGSSVLAYAAAAVTIALSAAAGGLTTAAEIAFIAASLVTVYKYAVNRKNSGVRSIVERIPYSLSKVEGGEAVRVPIGDVVAGDVIRIRTGEVIPFDGRIVSGSTSYDSSVLDGRAGTSFARVGDRVLGGTVNVFGFFDMEVESVGADTAIYRMSRLIDRMNDCGTAVSRLADRLASFAVISSALVSGAVFAVAGTPASVAAFALAGAVITAVGVLRMAMSGKLEWRNAESRFMRYSHVEQRPLDF